MEAGNVVYHLPRDPEIWIMRKPLLRTYFITSHFPLPFVFITIEILNFTFLLTIAYICVVSISVLQNSSKRKGCYLYYLQAIVSKSDIWRCAYYFGYSLNCETRLLPSSCLSVRLYWTTPLPVGTFSGNLTCEYFSKICWENSSFIKLEKIQVSLNSDKNDGHCIHEDLCTLMIVSCWILPKIKTHFVSDSIFLESCRPRQQWLRKCTTLLRHM